MSLTATCQQLFPADPDPVHYCRTLGLISDAEYSADQVEMYPPPPATPGRFVSTGLGRSHYIGDHCHPRTEAF